MTTALWFLIIAFPAALFWSSSRAAAETAASFGRQLCQRAGVQWLDQSVHQVSIGLKRAESGQLRWQRVFKYEYSHDGQDRYAGHITLLGQKAVSWVEPVSKPTVI
jgi:hypothetical protein